MPLDATVARLPAHPASLTARAAFDPRTRVLLEAPIARTLLRLAWPNILVTVAQAVTGLIQTWWVSRIGLDALAGMALVFPLFMMMQMLSAGAIGGGWLLLQVTGSLAWASPRWALGWRPIASTCRLRSSAASGSARCGGFLRRCCLECSASPASASFLRPPSTPSFAASAVGRGTQQ